MTEALRTIIKKHCLTIAPEGQMFTLSSGGKSRYYCDIRKISMEHHGARVIGNAIVDLIGRHRDSLVNIQAVGGLTMGADPIAMAVIHSSYGNQHLPNKAFSVRKEPKKHGTGKRVEGPVQPGNRVIVLEDTVTTGASGCSAIDALREFGCEVVAVIAVFDREEGGMEAFTNKGIPFFALVKASDVVPT